jgi:hypothetical protein
MTRPIWDGKGDVDELNAIWYTTNDGTLRGRPYVRSYVARKLAHLRWLYHTTRESEKAAIAATVDNDTWMTRRSGYLVAAILHDVQDYILLGGYREGDDECRAESAP